MIIRFIQTSEYEVDVDLEVVYNKFDGDVQRVIESAGYEAVFVDGDRPIILDTTLSHEDVAFKDALIEQRRREKELEAIAFNGGLL